MCDEEESVLRKMLHFCYTDECPTPESLDDSLEMLIVADKYGVLGMKALIENWVAPRVTKEHAVTTLICADKHNAPKLKERAMAMVVENFAELREDEGWSQLSASLVTDLLAEAITTR